MAVEFGSVSTVITNGESAGRYESSVASGLGTLVEDELEPQPATTSAHSDASAPRNSTSLRPLISARLLAYSSAIAARKSTRAARAAGSRPATTPATRPATSSTASHPQGIANTIPCALREWLT